MDTWESLVEVKHGLQTLVSRGEPMWAPVSINGRQAVQVVELLRAAGVKAIPRKNDANTLTFSICKEHTGVEAAAKALYAFPISLPRTMLDVTVKFADASGVKLKNATVESWSGDQLETTGRHTVIVIGGALEVIPAP